MFGEILPGSMSVHLAHTKHRLKATEAIKGNCLCVWTRQSQGAGAALLLFSLPMTYEPVVKCIVAASSL